MLSKPNYRILSHLKKHDGVVFSDSLPDGFTPIRLDTLAEMGYLNRQLHSSGVIVYQMLPAGEDALSSHRKEHIQRTNDKRNQNRKERLEHKRWRKDATRSWVQWAITTILSIAAFFAGAIVEVLTGFMEWIWSMLH